MLPFVAAGVAAGGVSYFVGLPLAYAAFLAIAIVAVAVGVTSALTVKVPQIEPKARKLKTEKNRHGSAAASSSLSSDTATDTSEKPDKAEDSKSEPKALSKRDKERAKKAAKKEADEKQKQAEADRAAAEEKQKQEAARAAKEAAAAAAKAAEAAEKERLAALEAEEDEEDEAPAKKNKKKKKKKTEEKKGNDSAPTPTAKPSESKNAVPTPTAKSSAPTPTAKKGEPADSKKSKDSSAKAEAASNKADASKKVEVAPKNTESPKHTPAAVEFEEKVDAKESATQDSSMAWEVKTSKKNKRAPEPAAAAVVPLTPTTASTSSDQKVEINIDPRNFGVIIGKQGSTLKQITEATQTNIDFSKKEEGRVTVSGPSRENIDKAIAAMNQLAAKGYSDLTHGVRDEGSIEVPSNKRFNIIGTKGETVRLIQDRLKVKVNMPDRNTSDSTVTVLGENADVQEALRCISDLMTKGYSEITHPGWVSEIVEVPSGQLGNIIGAQGATVREIQDSTGAKINIEGSTVTVLGQQTQVAEAKNKITQLLTPAEPLPADPEWSQGASARYVDLW